MDNYDKLEVGEQREALLDCCKRVYVGMLKMMDECHGRYLSLFSLLVFKTRLVASGVCSFLHVCCCAPACVHAESSPHILATDVCLQPWLLLATPTL